MKSFLFYSRQITDDICPECFTVRQARDVMRDLIDRIVEGKYQ